MPSGPYHDAVSFVEEQRGIVRVDPRQGEGDQARSVAAVPGPEDLDARLAGQPPREMLVQRELVSPHLGRVDPFQVT